MSRLANYCMLINMNYYRYFDLPKSKHVSSELVKASISL